METKNIERTASIFGFNMFGSAKEVSSKEKTKLREQRNYQFITVKEYLDRQEDFKGKFPLTEFSAIYNPRIGRNSLPDTYVTNRKAVKQANADYLRGENVSSMNYVCADEDESVNDVWVKFDKVTGNEEIVVKDAFNEHCIRFTQDADRNVSLVTLETKGKETDFVVFEFGGKRKSENELTGVTTSKGRATAQDIKNANDNADYKHARMTHNYL